MDRHLADLALAIYDDGAFKDYRSSDDGVGYKLDIHREKPDTPLSPFYISLRTPDHPVTTKRGPLKPLTVQAIGQEMRRHAGVMKLRFDRIVGIPEAGVPLAEAFHHAQPEGMQKGLVYLHKRPVVHEESKRKQKKEQSRFMASLEGDYNHKDRVLIVDDLVRYGGTKGEAAGTLKKSFRLVVEDCLVLIDQRPHRLRTESIAGLKVHAVFTIEDLVAQYRASGVMPEEVATRILTYLETA
ncbi:MAG: phosphoribosyltransferase [Patescibacteria group bacterium]